MADIASLLIGLQNREQLPPVVADELDQLTAGIQVSFNGLRDNLNAQGTQHCVAYSTATQSLTSGVITALTLDAVDSDPSRLFQVSTSKVLIQTTGFYLLIGYVSYAASAGGTARIAYLTKNGSLMKFKTVPQLGAVFTPSSDPIDVTTLNAGDAIGLSAFQDSGGALVVGNTTRFAANQLVVAKLF